MVCSRHSKYRATFFLTHFPQIFPTWNVLHLEICMANYFTLFKSRLKEAYLLWSSPHINLYLVTLIYTFHGLALGK